MSDRLAFRTIAPRAQRSFRQAGRDPIAGGREPLIKHLIDIRAFANGWVRVLRGSAVAEPNGVARPRIACILSPFGVKQAKYSAPKRAALAGTGAVTSLLVNEGVTDDAYDLVRQHFDDSEPIDLTVAINAHNRMNLAFRSPVGATQKDAKEPRRVEVSRR